MAAEVFMTDEFRMDRPRWRVVRDRFNNPVVRDRRAAPDTVRRFHAHHANGDRCYIVEHRPTATELRADVAATEAQLVVIDTLTELWSGRVESDRDANEVARFIRPYVEVARETGAALVLLHHTSKSGEQFRGSEQLAAAVDAVLTLRQPSARPLGGDDSADGADDGSGGPGDDGGRRLEGKGRAGVRVDVRLFFDGTLYRPGDGSLPLDVRILRALQLEPRTRSALATAVGVRKETVLARVHDLESRGFIADAGTGTRLLVRHEGLDALAAGTAPGTAPDVPSHTSGPDGTAAEPGGTGTGTTGGTASDLPAPAPISQAADAGTAPREPHRLHLPPVNAGEAV